MVVLRACSSVRGLGRNFHVSHRKTSSLELSARPEASASLENTGTRKVILASA